MVSAPAAFLRHLAVLAGRQGRAVQVPIAASTRARPWRSWDYADPSTPRSVGKSVLPTSSTMQSLTVW